MSAHIGETVVTESVEEKILAVTLDKKLDSRVMLMLYAKKHVSSYMDVETSCHRRRLRGGLGARATPGYCYGGAEPPLRKVQKFALYSF